MIRYALVYTFLVTVMLALVYIIGMPWKSRRYRPASAEERGKERPGR